MQTGTFQGVSISDTQIQIDGHWYDASVALVKIAWRWQAGIPVKFRLDSGVIRFLERVK